MGLHLARRTAAGRAVMADDEPRSMTELARALAERWPAPGPRALGEMLIAALDWRGIAAWRTLLSAVVGAFLGSKIADFVRLPDWSLLFTVVVAIVGVLVVTSAYRRKSRN